MIDEKKKYMKIAVSTTSGGLDDNVCQIFGRCPVFTIVEVNEGEISDVYVKKNQGALSQGGAGITAAQQIVDEKVETVISGNFGPNALKVLFTAGIKMYQAQGNVKMACENCLTNNLTLVETPTVKGHHGGN